MLWLARDHVEFDSWSRRVEFRLLAAYDVAGARGWSIEMAPQEWSELWLIQRGRVRLRLDEGEALIEAGHIALLHPCARRLSVNEPSLSERGSPLEIIGFSFQARLPDGEEALQVLARSLSLPLSLSLSSAGDGGEASASQQAEESQQADALPWRASFEQVVRATRGQGLGSSCAASGLAQWLFGRALSAMLGREGEKAALDILRRREHGEVASALSLIESSYAQPLDVAALARAAHLSPKHFARRWKLQIGMPPMEFLRRYRLQQAARLLENGSVPVSEAAARCGFEDAAHFSRAFRAHFGLSPTEFRHASKPSSRAGTTP